MDHQYLRQSEIEQYKNYVNDKLLKFKYVLQNGKTAKNLTKKVIYISKSHKNQVR